MTVDIAASLDATIKAVCPLIDGVSVGDPADKGTWRIDFRDEATNEERAAAEAALQSFDPGSVVEPVVVPGDVFFARLKDAEYSAVIAASAGNVQLARWIEEFRLRGEINVAGETALAAKAALIAAELFVPDEGQTIEDRADAVFAAAD